MILVLLLLLLLLIFRILGYVEDSISWRGIIVIAVFVLFVVDVIVVVGSIACGMGVRV